MENKEFSEFLVSNNIDILCLQETWTNSDSKIEMNNYVMYHKPRPFKHKKAKRNSGGIVVFIKDALHKGIQLVLTDSDGIMWFKLDKEFFSFEDDLYLCCAYLPPEKSQVYSVISNNEHIFDKLTQNITTFQILGKVIIMGDLNARTAVAPDYIMDDFIAPENDNKLYICDKELKRYSEDKVKNSFGTMLLDMCKSLKLRIVNGRLHSDAKIGKFTCETELGSSVIDYMLTGEEYFQNVSDFCVGKHTPFSDHNPLICIIKSGYNINHREEGKYVSTEKWKWNEATRNEYIQNLRTNIHRFENIVNNRNHTAQEAINDVIHQFSDTLLNIAEPFCKSVTGIRQGGTGFRCKRRKDAPWFDTECKMAKRMWTNAIYRYNNERSINN